MSGQDYTLWYALKEWRIWNGYERGKLAMNSFRGKQYDFLPDSEIDETGRARSAGVGMVIQGAGLHGAGVR
jgi:hypothetical protein